MPDEPLNLGPEWRPVTHAWERDPGDVAPRPVPVPIPPALTAEEWARMEYRNTWQARVHRREDAHPRDPSKGMRLVLNTSPNLADEKWLDRVEGAKLMALANAALPDGDARKITRDMVRALLACADWDEQRAAKGRNDWTPEGRARLREYAAALAAILPPEP